MADNSDGYGKKPLWQWVLMYLVIGGIVYGLVYYFVLAKSGGGYNYTAPAAPTSGASDSGSMMNKSTVTLSEENGSGETGTATLEEVNGKVQVTVALSGYPTDGTPQPAHLHVGACPGVGAVKYPLTPIVGGASVTMLDVSLSDLKAQLPLALNVHKSAKEAGVYTACGALAL